MKSRKFRSLAGLQEKSSTRRVWQDKSHRHQITDAVFRNEIFPGSTRRCHKSSLTLNALRKVLITSTVRASADEVEWENAAGLSRFAIVGKKVCGETEKVHDELVKKHIYYIQHKTNNTQKKQNSNCSPAWPRFEGWPSIPEQVCITSTKFASLGSSMKSTLSRFVKPGSAGSVHDAWEKR